MTPWTEEKLALLRELFDEGYSYARMAKAIGVTRSAALGKIYRLGWQRAMPSEILNPAHRRNIKSPYNPNYIVDTKDTKKIEPESVDDGATAFDKRNVPLIELHPKGCKYPTHQPPPQKHRFCNAPSKPNSPYCETHHKRCYNTNYERSASKVSMK